MTRIGGMVKQLMSTKRIPVAAPVFAGNEKKYVLDCLESTWISSNGEYIERFESAFAKFCGVKHAVSCSNGTTALHLALQALGVSQNDEVICPTLTFVATANAIVYCGGIPVFVDSESDTWNIDPAQIEANITPQTKGIIVVHLYGHPVDMEPILAMARRHGLFVLEDAAEAHGAKYKGQCVGSLGNLAIFSFYGNKIITTGEGGMVVTNDDRLASIVRQLKGQGMDPNRRYWFPIIGYNYRMTNIEAAIGLAQLEKVEWHIQRRLEIAKWYRDALDEIPGIKWQGEKAWAQHVYWMFSVMLDENLNRDEAMLFLQKQGIETRPVFYPIHTLPPYHSFAPAKAFPVANRIARTGINLPTWGGLTRADIDYICDHLRKWVNSSTSVI